MCERITVRAAYYLRWARVKGQIGSLASRNSIGSWYCYGFFFLDADVRLITRFNLLRSGIDSNIFDLWSPILCAKCSIFPRKWSDNEMRAMLALHATPVGTEVRNLIQLKYILDAVIHTTQAEPNRHPKFPISSVIKMIKWKKTFYKYFVFPANSNKTNAKIRTAIFMAISASRPSISDRSMTIAKSKLTIDRNCALSEQL